MTKYHSGRDVPRSPVKVERYKPIHVGNVYCSPGCGFKCKRASYDRAVREADKLCKVLGEGWEPCVWENCGWHFSARKSNATVHANCEGDAIGGLYKIVDYTIFFHTEKQIVLRGKNPVKLVAQAIAAAKAIARRVTADLAVLGGV